jgi:hypothetical protein
MEIAICCSLSFGQKLSNVNPATLGIPVANDLTRRIFKCVLLSFGSELHVNFPFPTTVNLAYRGDRWFAVPDRRALRIKDKNIPLDLKSQLAT